MEHSPDFSDVTAENFHKAKAFDPDSALYTTVRDFILKLLRQARHNRQSRFNRRLGSIRGGLANHLGTERRGPLYTSLTELDATGFACLVQQVIDTELTERGFKSEIGWQTTKGNHTPRAERHLTVSW